MGIDLVYPDFDGSPRASPFAQTLLDIADEETIRIACPYIQISHLRAVIDDADSWRLVTDVQEFVGTQPESERPAAEALLRTSGDYIHNCRNLHAKVAIGEDQALAGSANITGNGFEKNIELGVRFDGAEHVSELQRWFDELWGKTDPPDEEALTNYLERSPSTPRNSGTEPAMPDVGPAVNTTVTPLALESLDSDDPEVRTLIETVETAPSRSWITSYFDWVARVLDTLGIDGDDERIATTIPASGDKLPVNVNGRYVLTAYPARGTIGMMLPGESVATETLAKYIGDFGSFSTPDGADPYWFEFPGDPTEYITGEIEDDWEDAVRREWGRADRSRHKDKHRPVVVQAATNPVFRSEVLAEAF